MIWMVIAEVLPDAFKVNLINQYFFHNFIFARIRFRKITSSRLLRPCVTLFHLMIKGTFECSEIHVSGGPQIESKQARVEHVKGPSNSCPIFMAAQTTIFRSSLRNS